MLLSRIQKRIQRSMMMMRHRMVRLTIPWMEKMMELMMTVIHLEMTLTMRMRKRRTRMRRRRKAHLALVDSAIVLPSDELVSLPKGTEPIIPPPSTDITTTRARITVRLQDAISLPPEAKVERLLAMPTLSPSPLASLSPPSAGERLARCTAPATLPSPPLSPPLHMPPPIYRRDDIPETKMPPHKRLCLL
nr:hypothetical protein [Tanacetum cinerariifolium]